MKSVIKSVINSLSRNELRILPGNLAYSFFLALVPIVSLIFYVTTTFNLPNDIVLNFISETFPQGVAELIKPVFNTDMSIKSFIPIILGIVVAMNGCGAIIIASNTIYECKNSSLIKKLIKSLVIVVVLTLLFTFIFIVPLLGNTIINIISTFTDFISDNRTNVNILYFILKVPVTMIIMFYLVKFIYVIAPDEKVSRKAVNRGSAFTTIAWLIVTMIFSYYINNIARYDVVYGNLANVVILLFWFYIMAYIFVIGLCLNKEISDKNIEKTNSIKLEEIREKVKKNK